MTQSHSRKTFVAVHVAVVLALGGCARESVDSTAGNGEVRGRVTLDGQPLAGVTVALDDPKTKLGVLVKTEPDGSYVVRSHKDYGLPPGVYHVAVRPRREFETGEE